MSLDPGIRARLRLPAVCAPMFLVSGPDLVEAACRAGLIGVLPRQNARSFEIFADWLGSIRRGLTEYAADTGETRIGPVAVNLDSRMDPAELARHLDVCAGNGVQLIVSATGDPAELIKRVHDWGGKVFHDVTSLRFAEKAIAAGADGLTCIGAGGGGHSGTISHLALIPKVRSMFDGTILLAGAVTTGAAIRAAELLGADLAYLGTRFIATQESMAPPEYKQLLLSESSAGLRFTGAISGVPANWLVASMKQVGLDPDDLPEPRGAMRRDHLPEGVKPWKNVWSAGQGIDLIDDLPTVAELVLRLRAEYVEACATSDMAEAARLAERALGVR
ncbi:MAG: NAD(P)H-dependent flavin oxidoreductase [Mycobacteriales bacterium]